MHERITSWQQVNFLVSSTALRTAIPLLTCVHAHTIACTSKHTPVVFLWCPETHMSRKLVDNGGPILEGKEGILNRKKINTLSWRLIKWCYSGQQQREAPIDLLYSEKIKTKTHYGTCMPGSLSLTVVSSSWHLSQETDTSFYCLSCFHFMFTFYFLIPFAESPCS